VEVEADDRLLRILPDDREVALLALDVEPFLVGARPNVDDPRPSGRPAAEAAIASCRERTGRCRRGDDRVGVSGPAGRQLGVAFDAQARQRRRTAG